MISAEGEYFDTHVILQGECTEKVLSSALLECDKYERLLSKTIPGSDVWSMNHNTASVNDVSIHTKSILHMAEVFKRETNGLFDVSWSGEIDLGGIAKGYIADRIGDFLKHNGVQSALVNLGGNILTIGRNIDGNPWRIGLQYPTLDRTKRDLCYGVILSENDSVVTSGIYERGHWEGNKWESHIINPDTGKSIDNNVLSVTVQASSSFLADAITTPLLLLGPEKGFALVNKYRVKACYYLKENAILSSENMFVMDV